MVLRNEKIRADKRKQLNCDDPLYDNFANSEEDIEDSTFEKIGKTLQASWSNHFRNIFPERKIMVHYQNQESNYGPTLLVYEE